MFCSRSSWWAAQVSSPPLIRLPTHEVPPADDCLSRSSSHCFPEACLHWGLLQGEAYLDPLSLVGGGPIRLLPLDGAMLPWLVP